MSLRLPTSVLNQGPIEITMTLYAKSATIGSVL